MGRPRKELNKSQVAEVETLAAVLSMEQIADYFGIARTTFYEIMERQPEVSEQYKRGKSRAIKDIGTSLITKARGGDTTSQIFYLKTQAGWRETSQVDHTSSDGSQAPTTITFVRPKDGDE